MNPPPNLEPAVVHVTRVPVTISLTSGMMPLTVALGVDQLRYTLRWHDLQKRSWRLGNRYYGTEWNGLVPVLDERLLLHRLGRAREPRLAHFIWGEFGTLKHIEPYHRRNVRVVVSVHCSARRWDAVWRRPDGYARADHVVLTSESQRPCVERAMPRARVTTILHGVVTGYFTPPPVRAARSGRFRLLLLGNTERDHEFAAQVAAKLPADKFEWRVRTDSHERKHYAGVAFDVGQSLSQTQRTAIYNAARSTGAWGYVEPLSQTPTWVHFDRRYGTPACRGTTAGYPTLRRGSRGCYVMILQDALSTLGYQTGNRIDGIFGSRTEEALKGYQRRTSLRADGVCGCNSWKKISTAVLGVGRTKTTID